MPSSMTNSISLLLVVLPLLALAAAHEPLTPLPPTDGQRPLSVPPLPAQSSSGSGGWRSSERYYGEQVWRIRLGGGDLARMGDILESVDDLDLDIWGTTATTIDIRLTDRQKDMLESALKLESESALESFIPDLQALIEATAPTHHDISDSGFQDPLHQDLEESSGRPEISKKKSKPPKPDPFNLTTLLTPFHDSYHSLADIAKFGDRLVETFNGEQGLEVWDFTVGTSWEGREIKGWSARFGNEPDNGEDGDEEPRREIVIMSGQHGREWVGPSSALYFLHSTILSALYPSINPDPSLLLRHFTVTIIPLINPDGFEYSQHHRMWRKNRQEVGHKSCLGIDLNSNWGFKWKGQKKVRPCKEGFPGREPFEAVETRAVADWLESKKAEGVIIKSFVDLHSYGQLFMFPYAHSCDDFPVDAEMLMEAGMGVAKAIRTTHGQAYETGQACDLTYRQPGDSVDYSYGVADIRWSYSAELRDTGTYGFMLPKDLIRPTAEEISAGILHLAKFIYLMEVAD
ncbi:hypothetical protein L202_04216 [Cryptococcus amylolentus CBS 6039]|uniref:Inactive metallocarboxypeptidase ECM14 n=1 Tax=Cryptococcus amylolentus CBS 6039 TaxID=1295533 RepID=A0A1E3HQM0_9TREE|nr:hypothetical protein L202_04216 [Cryptococcus amylolentus CBS 6039]ODN78617.1 hypothetical protein L202_04216 [Cryptococcus amylolentus CBS 6039]